MRSDLLAAVDAFDRVIAAARELIDPAVLDPVATTVRQVRERAGYLGDTLVAAVAGGTGSGKSSLINALAGEEVARSGGMRPTTGKPLGWIPANPEPGLVRLLDDLGVEERVGQDLHPWLALLDLPDTDSVVADHRHTVEALLPRVDLVLWVIDPEKYQDRVLHSRYLQPLAAYHRQFVFVLNQIDRLAPGTVDDLVSDLRQTLVADGIPEPTIVTVAADPDVGPPIGIDDLVAVLEDKADVKEVVYGKLATDLREAAKTLTSLPEFSGGTGFEASWNEARDEAARLLASGDRRRAVARLDGFVDSVAGQAGGGVAAVIRQEVTPDSVAEAVEVAYEASGAYRTPAPVPAPGWARPVRWVALVAAVAAVVWGIDSLRAGRNLLWPVVVTLLSVAVWAGVGVWVSSYRSRATRRLLAQHREELIEPIARLLDTHLGKRLRGVLRRRAGATAAATELDLALAELERRLGVG